MGERLRGDEAVTDGVPLRRLGRLYEEGRGRIVELVETLEAEETALSLPACPGWSVHDVLAHMTGVCADIMAGNVLPAPTSAWTRAQVEARSGKTIAEVIDEWSQVGPQVASIVDDFPGQYGTQLVTDVSIHEHDIRGALDRPGARQSDGVRTSLEHLLRVPIGPSMSAVGLGPLEVRTGTGSWIVGSSSGEGDPDAAWMATLSLPDLAPPPDEDPIATLDIDEFELFRAITGRRSSAQIERYAWSGDPEPYLPMFGFGPFTIRDSDLKE